MIKHQLVIDFSSPPQDTYAALVDGYATFLRVVVSPEGVVAFYNISPDSSGETRTDEFKILADTEEAPENFYFVDILSTIVENEDHQQKLMVFPVYMKIGEMDNPF